MLVLSPHWTAELSLNASWMLENQILNWLGQKNIGRFLSSRCQISGRPPRRLHPSSLWSLPDPPLHHLEEEVELTADLKCSWEITASLSSRLPINGRTALSEVPLHLPPGGLLNIHALIKQFYRCYLPGDDKRIAPGRALHADKNLSACVCTRAHVRA